MKVGDIIEVRNLIDEDAIKNADAQLPLKDVLKTGLFLVTTIAHDLTVRTDEKKGITTEYIMRIRAVKDSKGGEYA